MSDYYFGLMPSLCRVACEEDAILSTRVRNSPAKNFLNLAVHLALVLRSPSRAFGALNIMFRINARMVLAPLFTFVSLDFIALLTV